MTALIPAKKRAEITTIKPVSASRSKKLSRMPRQPPGRSLRWALLAVATLSAPLLAESVPVPVPLVSGAELLESSQQPVTDQWVPLGSVKQDSDGRISPERSQRVSGIARKALFQLPAELALTESQRAINEKWTSTHGDASLLYRCAGRDCGQSSLWANEVLDQALLFGNDRTQFAYVFLSSDKQTITMLYGSERPNLKSYYGEFTLLLAKPWDAPALVASTVARLQWQLDIPRNDKDQVDPKRLGLSLVPVLDGLKKSATTHWSVVASDCSARPANDAFARSQALLDAVLPVLQNASTKQFHAINLGNTFSNSILQNGAIPNKNSQQNGTQQSSTATCLSGKNLEIIELQP